MSNTKPILVSHDAITNETIEREMTDEEIALLPCNLENHDDAC